ncbi:hypothetical protein R3P38DRAFT_3098341 [Favolaschia claudopus]|uniref:MYND-type domain-containing protein n=1 Tax=Favolaschia claudopus TaxID=2862362 RepID=A0AAV9ZNZ1_9AGAR
MAAAFVNSLTTSPSHDLPMFHDGLVHHTHQKCSGCLQMQRLHHTKLSLCSACQINSYCSRECQKAHWKAHKAECTAAKERRLTFAKVTGIESAFPDFSAWVKYYSVPLTNCAIAAMRLSDHPHAERTLFLCAQIHHTGDLTLPIPKRFIVRAIGLRQFEEISPLSALHVAGKRYPEFIARGKIELGDSFYGCVRVAIMAGYGSNPEVPNMIAEEMKHISIDKQLARARLVREDWWMLFREYVALGARVRFCCGRLPGADDVCCCGGWIHDEEKRKAFLNLGNM